MPLRAFVVGHRPEDRYLAGRTLRSLAAAGWDAQFAFVSDRQVFFPTDTSPSPTLLVRAGAWLGDTTPIPFPERNATGRPTCAFGRLLGPPGEELNRWKATLSRSGGDFNRPPADDSAWPSPVALYLDAAATTALSTTNARTPLSFGELTALGFRVVHFPKLDVHLTSSLRVMQVITALHRGGAERLTLDLVDFLPNLGVQTRLATLGRPFRSTFPPPPRTLERPDPSQLRAFAIANGYDLFHAHLLNRDTLKALGADGFPLIVTLHNARGGWPSGTEQIASPDASLVAACSRAVESDAVAAGIPVPIRTAWNGIRLKTLEMTPEIQRQAQNLRSSWGFDSKDIVLLALANPRPQKRLYLLPAILEALQSAPCFRPREATADDPPTHISLNRDSNTEALHHREEGKIQVNSVPQSLCGESPSDSPSEHRFRESQELPTGRGRFRLVLAGEAPRSLSSQLPSDADPLESDFRKRGILQDVRFLGFVDNIAALISACDALVSPSAFEGLSLAQLECLALGRPVIATAVGGASEVAAIHPSLRLVPVDATPEAFAQAILDALAAPSLNADETSTPTHDDVQPAPDFTKRFPAPHPLAPFSTESMAARYHWLYLRAIARHRLPKVPLLNPSSMATHFAEGVTAQASQPPFGQPAKNTPPPGSRLWLITNNFSTGGAQSSARRWLLECQSRGIEVRAVVVQEDPRHPTPGRQALLASGIPVVAVSPPDQQSPEAAVEDLLHCLDADRATAVFFWNLIPVYKILLADALFETAIYDVSPGEMLFDSLDRYFASPLPHLPYRSPHDYASRLAGIVVKYSRERSRAEYTFNIPVHVIPNGISIDDFPLRTFPKPHPPSPPPPTTTVDNLQCSHSHSETQNTEHASTQAPLIFGTSARLHPHKRIEDLIDALKEAHPHLPPWCLRIAGGAEAGGEAFADSLRQRGEGLPIEWLGDVTDIRSFLASLDLFLMISEPAGCPNALLEAMATGLPVIATDVGGAKDLMEHGISGWLVPPREPQAFAHAVLALAHDPSLRSNLGQAARQRIEEHFTVRHMVDRYLALLSENAVQGTGPT